MVNLVLGILIGIAGSWLYARPQNVPWYVWGLFALSAALFVFAADVLIGSFREHQPRAAWMGLALFGGMGVVIFLAGWNLGL